MSKLKLVFLRNYLTFPGMTLTYFTSNFVTKAFIQEKACRLLYRKRHVAWKLVGIV